MTKKLVYSYKYNIKSPPPLKKILIGELELIMIY